MICSEKIFVCLRKLHDVRENFLYVRQNLGGEILVLSLPVRANYTVPPPPPNQTMPVRP
jgi:hypothetical protein